MMMIIILFWVKNLQCIQLTHDMWNLILSSLCPYRVKMPVLDYFSAWVFYNSYLNILYYQHLRLCLLFMPGTYFITHIFHVHAWGFSHILKFCAVFTISEFFIIWGFFLRYCHCGHWNFLWCGPVLPVCAGLPSVTGDPTQQLQQREPAVWRHRPLSSHCRRHGPCAPLETQYSQ